MWSFLGLLTNKCLVKIDDDQEFYDDPNMNNTNNTPDSKVSHTPLFVDTGINWFGVSHRWCHMQVHAWVTVHHSSSMSTQVKNLCVATLWGTSASVGSLFALGLGSCCCQTSASKLFIISQVPLLPGQHMEIGDKEGSYSFIYYYQDQF